MCHAHFRLFAMLKVKICFKKKKKNFNERVVVLSKTVDLLFINIIPTNLNIILIQLPTFTLKRIYNSGFNMPVENHTQ